jgi:NAD(P)H-nitrite reductase large subunit
MNREKVACSCNKVTYGMIVDAVKSGSDTYEAVQEKTNCGKSCGKCEDFIRSMVRDIKLFPQDYE